MLKLTKKLHPATAFFFEVLSERSVEKYKEFCIGLVHPKPGKKPPGNALELLFFCLKLKTIASEKAQLL